MSVKEWKRNELFHLLMEKFGLRSIEEFKITGTGLTDITPTPWNQSSDNQSRSDLSGVPYSAQGKISGTTEIPKIKDDSRGADGLSWDSNLDQAISFKSDNADFDKQLDIFKKAVASKESGKLGYKALGIPVHEYGYDGDRARGKYQIMGKNWPKWAKEAGLPESTWDPDTGMTPENQEFVASYKFKQYYNKFGGDWKKVAIAWYSGPSGMDKKVKNYKKVYHKGHDKPFPSIAEYGDDIISRMNKQTVTEGD